MRFVSFTVVMASLFAVITANTHTANNTNATIPTKAPLTQAETLRLASNQAKDTHISYLGRTINYILDFIFSASSYTDTSEQISRDEGWAMIFKSATEYEEQGDIDWTVKIFDSSLDYATDLFRKDINHKYTLHSLMGLASVYAKNGLRLQAIKLYENGVQRVKHQNSHENENAVEYFLMLGGLNYNNNEFNAAVSYYEQALEILAVQNEETDYKMFMIDALTNIGLSHFKTNRYSKALDYLEKALKMAQRVLKPTHAEFSYLQNNLGSVYERLGDNEKAIKHYLDEHENILFMKAGKKQSFVLIQNTKKIALIYAKLQQPALALDYFNRFVIAVRSTESPIEDSHQLVGMALLEIGDISRNNGQNNEAFRYFSQAIEELGLFFKGDHQALADIMFNTGSVLIAAGSAEKAADYFERSVEMRRRLHPNQDDFRLALTLQNLGFTHGNTYKACTCYEESLEMYRRLLPRQDGDEPADTMIALIGVANCRLHYKQLDEALSFALKSIEVMEREKRGSSSNEMIRGLMVTASVLIEMESYDEAERYLTRWLESMDEKAIYYKNYLPIAYQSFMSLYEKQGNWAKSIEYGLKKVDAMKLFNSENFTAIYSELATYYNNTGEHLKAIEYLEDNLSYLRQKDLFDHNDEIGLTLFKIGDQHERLDDLVRSLDYYTQSIGIFEHEGKKVLPNPNLVELSKKAVEGIKIKIGYLGNQNEQSLDKKEEL
jgi:tetratricopeptide (TPR) repeat protein